MTVDKKRSEFPLTSSHWGTYRVESRDGKPTEFHRFEEDIDPSPIGSGILDVLEGPTRITEPMVRKSWYEQGPGAATEERGRDSFIKVSWDEAYELVARELERVREHHGNESIYGGSYGWASAGRFHHAQSQLHRFLNCIGGYTKSVNSYSLAAGEVVVPHVLGAFKSLMYQQTSWQSVIDHSELLVAFGGMPISNSQISSGGLGRHRTKEALLQAAQAGVEFVNVSPMKTDVIEELNAQWLAPRPSTDVALLLAIAHTLISEKLFNSDFLDRCTVGFTEFEGYVLGRSDGIEKSAQWAETVTEIPAMQTILLARKMASSRTMISVSWSLTRQDHGEQPYWAAIAVASLLGQIGLPGAGITFGYAATNGVGLEKPVVAYTAFPQGKNPVKSYIPVARISDMLLHAGEQFDYNGMSGIYPDVKLIYWAGGNPFHHHQDLGRLLKAWQKPETVIVHDWCWNALTKHADIVLPCTTTLERTDIAMGPRDPYLIAMEQVMAPIAQAKDDYDIFTGIAYQMGAGEMFTEKRTSEQWQQWLFDGSRESAEICGVQLPTLAELREKKWHKLEEPAEPNVIFSDFRRDPLKHALSTPSGKIELFSSTIDSFKYDDCVGHPCWYEPQEWLGSSNKKYPLHLISSQPRNKLHSQLDHGGVSRASKIKGREPVMINTVDAKARQIEAEDVVRLFNERGACLAAAVISDSIRQGVLQLSTGAWMDLVTQDDGTLMCVHGNPNMLTLDKGTSKLAQGPTAHSCLVQIECFVGKLPPITAFCPPTIESSSE
jgi:biotin/methionine sulfoxide reductase